MSLFQNMKARSIGPAGMSGRITAIDVVNHQPEIIYAGAASGGLWKSESGGIHWEPIFDQQKVASIGAIAVYQKNPDILWVGTGEGNPRNSQTNGYGVYRSLDGGKHWQCMGLEETRNIHRIIIHPDNPDIIYVGAQGAAWGDHPQRGVFKSTDGGKSWRKVLYVNEKTGIADLVMDPRNPNKLLAAMWEFRRTPWSFTSGGPGSGLYISYDGGESWEKRTHQDGLPQGELGRMGLAIAPSSPNIIYALIESKKNALYKSTDGGFNWRKINDKEDIGNRPFYYYDIFVDPQNENRLYSIHSLVTVSEDGGKSFNQLFSYSAVHPDHHAWWIHPTNPNFLIDGNDGGLAISRDRGKTWRFVENLPLAQFYHINVDNDIPYHVYGGMQDNGSWRGPAYTWRSGGIRNAYWEELFFGDGFDVVPHPTDSQVGYAMSQGGNLGRYDLRTGLTTFIKPVHPEGVFLRFNWNAGIAQDPFDENTIYYGSQFLHKSTDRGDNWEIISPDLTTNDPQKQQQLESGGLTYDVTQAENHTTIIAIAPSPVERGLIWVGTDDGNLQLTRDGGKSWTNLSDRIKEAPKGAWIPQIHPSAFQAGEAYVVMNHYRMHDYNPYVFRTRNYGKSWERIVNEQDVWGYALSIVQDPIEPRLLFLGTEYGLYVSVDEGENWNKWEHGYPTVSTMDLKIHPREHDLVIGTFGRAAYVLDDIRPLRALARQGTSLLDQTVAAFEVPTAYQANRQQATGTRFAGWSIFQGENRPFGAMISFYVKEGAAKDGRTAEGEKPRGQDSVKIEILSAAAEHVRSLRMLPDTGLNRINWNLRHDGVLRPGSSGRAARFGPPSGIEALPGVYTINISYKGETASTSVEVKPDPRMQVSQDALQARFELLKQLENKMAQLGKGLKQLDAAKESIELVIKQLPKEGETADAIRQQAKELNKQINEIKERILPKEGVQGIRRDPNLLLAKAGVAGRYLSSSVDMPGDTHKMIAKQSEAAMDEALASIQDFFKKDWEAFRSRVEAAALSPFVQLNEKGE
ncbi:MAG: hypothetical protein D6730_17535 [Bacteroidetes bacterium]|nr:MAG: hypothetical protein D6730_17535 [Bacteroidota bacterium]